ncbi:MAG: alpha/beta hydrolase [Promethearchaeota archaeon]
MKNDFNELESLKPLAKPFYFEGSEVGVLLVHGFTASPTETLPLGKFLHKKGYTVHGIRLAGHGTNYRELSKFTWHDWYKSVETGYLNLKEFCQTVFPIGISLGAILCFYLVHQHHEAHIPKLILLAPPFALKSRLIKLIPLLQIFKKYLYKGETSLQYFKEHNLYSYMYRPITSIIQLTRFLNHINSQPISITIPTLIAYGAFDDMISISAIFDAKEQKFATSTDIEILELPKSGHILTVEPDSEELFIKIDSFLKKNRSNKGH